MTPTVGDLLRQGAERLDASGSESARLDAELLLGHVLGVERTTVLAHPEAQVGQGQLDAFEDAVARRETGEPVAYIRSFKEFYGLAFSVDPRALIPRPETERLVDLAERHVRESLSSAPRPEDAPHFVTWDVGTGSGAVAVALAVSLRRRGYAEVVRFLATDRSPDALALAVENAVAHGAADMVRFEVADLFDVDDAPSHVDLVVANLPYIPTASVPTLPVAASFEPREALDGGPDGLDVIRRLLDGLAAVLAPRGAGFLEIGADQGEAAAAAAQRALPGWAVSVLPDLGGSPRVLAVHRPD